MTSYFASLLTTTTSRVATLRQNLLPSENDGDTIKDTHICRVLRAYYTEKGRNFPAWLPADPKAPLQAPQDMVSTSNIGQNYGGGINQTPVTTDKVMSSLWDKQQPRQQQQAPASRNPFGRPQGERPPAVKQPEPRRLPSEKPGSYQNVKPVLSAKDKFKLEKGSQRSQSPVVSGQSQNSYASSGNFGGNRRGESAQEPFVEATSPWASNASEFRGEGYGNGGYDSGGGPTRPAREMGLPANPRRGYR